jgi:hypothetical protein
LNKQNDFSLHIVGKCILLFYAFLLLSYAFSPYSDYKEAMYWLANYWKLIVVYYLISVNVRTLDDLKFITIAIGGIVICYQAYSWFDFLKGGSYVWQQGMKRIVGVWTSDIGSANAFGMLSLYYLPFGFLIKDLNSNGKLKLLACFTLAISMASIVFSGTRGALIAATIFLGWQFRLKASKVVLGIVLLMVSIYFMPDYIKYRYGIIDESEYQVSKEVQQIQKGSAQGRLQGLIDGFNLALERPLMGFGPGTSAIARYAVNDWVPTEEYFQLHSLYGQLLGESGFGGSILFALIIIVIVKRNWGEPEGVDEDLLQVLNAYQRFFNGFLLALLVYGLASHTLYRYYWFIMFGLFSAFDRLRESLSAGEKP